MVIIIVIASTKE